MTLICHSNENISFFLCIKCFEFKNSIKTAGKEISVLHFLQIYEIKSFWFLILFFCFAPYKNISWWDIGSATKCRIRRHLPRSARLNFSRKGSATGSCEKEERINLSIAMSVAVDTREYGGASYRGVNWELYYLGRVLSVCQLTVTRGNIQSLRHEVKVNKEQMYLSGT